MKIFTRGKVSKKASLSLSMEAIVILILAVTMLGLGLTFVRTMFSNITSKATNAIDVADLTAKPTEGDPIVFSPNAPIVKEKNTINVQVGFYNPSTTKEWWIMKIKDKSGNKCDDGESSKCDGGVAALYNPVAFKLEKDQSTGYNIIFTPAPDYVDKGATKAVLLSVQFCSTSENGPDCEDSAEVYQKEMFMTVRK